MLTGYETITITSNDFNAVPHHWFNRFVSPPEKGSLCDPHVISLGDQVFTNASLFTWTIQTIDTSDEKSVASSFEYTGTTLETCDVSEVDLLLNNLPEVVGDSVTVSVLCNDPPLVMTTSYDNEGGVVTGPLGTNVPKPWGFMPLGSMGIADSEYTGPTGV